MCPSTVRTDSVRRSAIARVRIPRPARQSRKCLARQWGDRQSAELSRQGVAGVGTHIGIAVLQRQPERIARRRLRFRPPRQGQHCRLTHVEVLIGKRARQRRHCDRRRRSGQRPGSALSHLPCRLRKRPLHVGQIVVIESDGAECGQRRRAPTDRCRRPARAPLPHPCAASKPRWPQRF
jgi:hypothetical protein